MIGIDDGEDESHWQDRVSSGFDRLVAFASIELTKSRRSIEEGPPSISPDSGKLTKLNDKISTKY